MNFEKIDFTYYKSWVLLLFILGWNFQSFAQCSGACGPNLINNSSFELMTTDCDTMNPEIFTDYSQVQDWFGTACKYCPGNGSTPDYYNSSCTGASPTENCGLGTGSVGFFTSVDVGGSSGSNAREYVQTQLSSPLVAGQEYCATIHVKTSPASFAYVPTDGLGLWFTNAMVDIDVDNGGQQFLGPGSIVNATPQIANPAGNIIDTVCTTITGSFVATGTETWMVMGNFRPDNMIQTSATNCGGFFTFCFGYLIVDQVELVPVCSSCDATISAVGPFCISDSPTNLTAVDPGGTWSGPGITDANNGTFDPTVAGVGSHDIIYDLSCGDDDTITIVVNALDDASFNYPSATYCLSDTDPVASITGLTGGNFSIDNSGVINVTDGTVDLSASGVGTFTITYTTTGACPNSSDVSIDILNAADATITAAGPFCENDVAINLSAADNGGIWSGTGITDANQGTFDPAVAGAGNHMITYEITGSCGDIDSIAIVVNVLDDASFSYGQNSYCIASTDPTPAISGLSGGTFSIDGTGVINSSSGEIDLDASGLGNYIVTYLTAGMCPNSSTFNITISSSLDAAINPAGPFCENDAAMNLSAADNGGIWSGSGITDANQGTFDPSVAGTGSHQIIYTISGICGDADTINIQVNPSDNASISYPNTSYCSNESDPLPTITGSMGGTFSIDNGGVIDTNSGLLDLDASGAGTFNITYITSGTCPDTATFTINISSGIAANINPTNALCLGDASITLTASPIGGTWSGNGITDSANGTFDPSTAGVGNHTIYYAIGGACPTSDSIVISVVEQPTVSLQGSYTITYGSTEVINANYSGTGTFSWSPDENLDCNDCPSPAITPTQTETICVQLSNGTCSDTACTQIIVDYNCGEVVVPTAFSPNSEDVNALECVLGSCVTNMHFTIYDRWGELVFESTDQNNCWDGTHMRNGKAMSTGVYVYQLDADLIDGTSINQKGNITLLR